MKAEPVAEKQDEVAPAERSPDEVELSRSAREHEYELYRMLAQQGIPTVRGNYPNLSMHSISEVRKHFRSLRRADKIIEARNSSGHRSFKRWQALRKQVLGKGYKT